MKGLVAFSAALMLLAGCVSADKQNVMKLESGNATDKLKLSVEERSELSTDNFMVFEFTLKNEGEDFARFDKIELQLPTKVKDKAKLVVGQDLVNWSEGLQNKIKMDDYNHKMLMSGIVALGGATALVSQDRATQNLGLGAMAAGSGILTVDEFLKVRNNAKNSQVADQRGLIPENHLMYVPINVPPNLFLNRFVVFHIPKSAKEDFVQMKVTLSKQKEEPKIYIARWADSCEREGAAAIFKGKQIYCKADCNQFHPLERSSCQNLVRFARR